PTPVPVITGDDSTCQDKISLYSSSPHINSTCLWSVQGGNIIGSATQSSVEIQWGAPGIGIVYLSVISERGCDSTISKNVLIRGAPVPIVSGPKNVCEYENAVYDAQAIPGCTYEWFVSGGTPIGGVNSSQLSVQWE